MKTLKEIEAILKTLDDLNAPYFQELGQDPRAGVAKLVKKYQNSLIKLQKLKEDHLKRQIFEHEYRIKGFQTIAGVDEVGRGPLAGPLVIGAVVLPEDCSVFLGMNDSKQLSQKKRQHYVDLIKENALAYCIKEIDVATIDHLNIYQATKRGMESIVNDLSLPVDFTLVDAMKLSEDIPHISLIKGDQRSLSIAAASILSKDYRDQKMVEYAQLYPEYGFDKHVGYGTAQHLQALHEFGPCPIHRQSFEPIRSMIS